MTAADPDAKSLRKFQSKQRNMLNKDAIDACVGASSTIN